MASACVGGAVPRVVSLRAGKTFIKPFFDLFWVNKGFLIKFAPPKPLFSRFAPLKPLFFKFASPKPLLMSSAQNLYSSNLYLGWTGWGAELFTPAVEEDSCARETRMPLAHDDCKAVRSACSRCHRLGGCSRVHHRCLLLDCILPDRAAHYVSILTNR